VKNRHRTLIGAAAVSLAVAGSLAGARPAKADTPDTICTTECGPIGGGPVFALQKVMSKMELLTQKWDAFDKTSPLLNVMSKIEQIIVKFD
jgi:hypothetical protein